MGKADTVTKAYMRENAVFADAFNFLIYGGRRVIDPDALRELDTTEIALPFGNQTEDSVQKYRDILKSTVIMQDDAVSYVLLGIENQTDVHYAMPVRNAIYDALQYGKQVAETAEKHRREKGGKQHKGAYLSGFYKEDRLIPVITVVIHFGAKEWDGPRSLHDMIDVPDAELLKFIPDYQIHLIDPARLTKEELDKFETSLREVMGYIKYSRDKEKLAAFLNDHAEELIEVNAARVIKTITKTPIEIPEGAEVINMCEAIEAMMKDSKAVGRAEGKAEGKTEGIMEGTIRTLVGLVKDGLLSAKDAAARLDMTESNFESVMKSMS